MEEYYRFLSDILEPMIINYQVAEEFLNKGLLSTWLTEALTECESNNNDLNKFAAVNLLTTLWRIFYDTRGFDETSN